jgi:hypothetical protein
MFSLAQNDIFCHFDRNVDALDKTLKTKVFILEKFLDTGFRPLLRFLPESSDGFVNLRWNYSPLKKKAVQSCRTAFSFSLSLRSKPLEGVSPRETLPHLLHAARRPLGLAAEFRG